MAMILGVIVGGVLGGFLFSSLFAWLLRRFAGAPLGGSFFFGWIGCCLLATWGMSGGGGFGIDLFFGFVGYGLGAWLAYALKRREVAASQDLADFE